MIVWPKGGPASTNRPSMTGALSDGNRPGTRKLSGFAIFIYSVQRLKANSDGDS